MKISEKIELFKRGNLPIDAYLDKDGRKKNGCLGIAAKPLLQEANSRIHSVVCAKHCSFIGFNSYMNDGGYIRDYVFVGRYCSIGRRVTLNPWLHPYTSLSTSPSLYVRGNSYTPEQLEHIRRPGRENTNLIIKNDVFIGDGAIILPSVTIGTGSIVGSNSVVTDDVEPYTIVGGIPAKKIGERFSRTLSKELLATEYWEYDYNTLHALPRNNVFRFLDKIKHINDNKLYSYKTYGYHA